MTCEAPTKCEFVCTGGNCDSVICKADTCDQSCTGGGCGLECHGNTCEQSCTLGNCALQCPSQAETCKQTCTANKDKCTIEYIWCTGACILCAKVGSTFCHDPRYYLQLPMHACRGMYLLKHSKKLKLKNWQERSYFAFFLTNWLLNPSKEHTEQPCPCTTCDVIALSNACTNLAPRVLICLHIQNMF